MTTADNGLVKVAYAGDEAEAEFVRNLLSDADIRSVVRRAPGFDVPEFLAAGPREVLVAAADVPVARDVLRHDEPVEPGPPSQPGAGRPSRALVWLLIAMAIVAFVVCIAAGVLV